MISAWLLPLSACLAVLSPAAAVFPAPSVAEARPVWSGPPASDEAGGDPSRPTPPVPGDTAAPLRDFAPPARPWLSGHRGIDLPAAAGAVVRAPWSGTVTVARRIVDREVLVIARGGLAVTLQPVAAVVDVGESVTAGDVVGHVGPPHGHCSTSCLHWGLRLGEHYLDPRLLLTGPRPRLIPPE